MSFLFRCVCAQSIWLAVHLSLNEYRKFKGSQKRQNKLFTMLDPECTAFQTYWCYFTEIEAPSTG